MALQQVRRFDEAITAHQDAAAIFRETGDRHREGAALGNLERGSGKVDLNRTLQLAIESFEHGRSVKDLRDIEEKKALTRAGPRRAC